MWSPRNFIRRLTIQHIFYITEYIMTCESKQYPTPVNTLTHPWHTHTHIPHTHTIRQLNTIQFSIFLHMYIYSTFDPYSL